MSFFTQISEINFSLRLSVCLPACLPTCQHVADNATDTLVHKPVVDGLKEYAS